MSDPSNDPFILVTNEPDVRRLVKSSLLELGQSNPGALICMAGYRRQVLDPYVQEILGGVAFAYLWGLASAGAVPAQPKLYGSHLAGLMMGEPDVKAGYAAHAKEAGPEGLEMFDLMQRCVRQQRRIFRITAATPTITAATEMSASGGRVSARHLAAAMVRRLPWVMVFAYEETAPEIISDITAALFTRSSGPDTPIAVPKWSAGAVEAAFVQAGPIAEELARISDMSPYVATDIGAHRLFRHLAGKAMLPDMVG